MILQLNFVVYFIISVCIAAVFFDMKRYSHSQIQENNVIGVSGSLVVAMACKDGLLVVSDRLTKDSIHGKRDTTTKLQAANDFTVVASTGTPTFFQTMTAGAKTIVAEKPFFDANQAIVECLNENPGSENVYNLRQTIANGVINRFDKSFKSLSCDGWPRDVQGENSHLFQSAIFHWNRLERRFEVLVLRFNYCRYPKPSMSVEDCLYKPEAFDKVHPLCFGNTEVIDRLGSGNEFPDYNRDNLLVSSKTPKLASEMSVPKAAQLAARLVAVTYKYQSPTTPNPVGDTVDVFLLDPMKGLRSLHSAVSVRVLDKTL